MMKRTGFTLIELLVVIAIIAILAAILFPVFAKAREKARQTACTNNQRQIVTAALMYTQDHEEMLPEASEFWGVVGVEKASIKCPSRVTIANGYGYNIACSGKSLGKLDNPQAICVTADADSPNPGTVNGAVLYPNVIYNSTKLAKPHSKKTIASFLDGHVELGVPSGASSSTSTTTQINVGFSIPLVNDGFETGSLSPWTGTAFPLRLSNDPGYLNSIPPPEGNYVCVLQNSPFISQTFTVSDAWSYKVTFQTKGRNGSTNQLRISIDSTVVGTLTPASDTSYGWISTPAFALTEGDHTLTIAGVNVSGDRTSMVDTVKIVSE